MRGWRRVGAVVLAVALAGCTSTVAGTGHPARPHELAVPLDDAERLFAAQMARLRAWDVCAMHDVAAAERATGAVAFAVRPIGGFDGCEIALESAGSGRLSYVTIEVAELVPGSGADAEVAGRTFAPVAPADGAADRPECGYSRAVALGWGVVVRGEVADDPDASCVLARDYLTDVLPRIDDPPLRAAAGTDPAFVLGGQDPCAALAALAPVPDTVDVALTGPRDCAVVDGTGVRFGLVQFETDVPGATAFTAAARLETVQEGTGACVVTRQASDTTLLAPSLPYLYREAVSVTDTDCDTARRHVERIVASLPPPAAPAVGALELGSLEGFPVAADVGAPFDPCSTIGWSAFPPEVRPPGADPRPFPSPVGPDTLYRVGCDYDSDAVASMVSWGPPEGAHSVDPAVRPGTVTRFAGRLGLEDRPAPAPGEAPLCLSTMQIGTGLAGVATLARDTRADPCAVNRSVLETLAPLVP